MPLSIADKAFKTKAFEGWKQTQEYEAKTQNAIIERLNTVIKAIGIVAKVTAGR